MLAKPLAPPEEFLEAMANVCTPVTIVTTATTDGAPYGTTVSAFASLSLDPPMVSISLGRESRLLAHIRRSETIGVNILAANQADLATWFARSQGDKFQEAVWAWDSQLPRLDQCAGWLTCTVNALIDGGDHVVVLACVNTAQTSSAPPLVYARRKFGTHSALNAQVCSD
ncbi:flavin reductase family protein [Aeromicrobium ginsengisoli]|uniref:Flavin reductase family protein n=2 Tax=Aeromicrobium ginsengisoli TaxID=363867 RepID=A0A5M4FGG4_9ACTN|nr:flavin reductase family protein [Aeromicrobium ginsengisoli]